MSGSRTRLVRLHILFRDADTLGSLIDPKRAVEITDPTGLQTSFDDVEWDDIAPLLDRSPRQRESDDPATAVLGADAAGIARAADYLSRHYTVVSHQRSFPQRYAVVGSLRRYVGSLLRSRADLATVFLLRSVSSWPYVAGPQRLWRRRAWLDLSGL